MIGSKNESIDSISLDGGTNQKDCRGYCQYS